MDNYLIDKFNNRYIKSDGGCWMWTGDKTLAGYGVLNVRGSGRKRIYAHRLSYEIKNGPFDKKLQVCHKCDNPRCVNPEHLFLGTAKDNALDMCKKGRWNAGPPSGVRNPSAKLNPKKVIEIRSKHLLGSSQRSLAKEYEVSKFTIFSIIKGITWKEVI